MGPSAGINLNYLLLSTAAHSTGKLHIQVNPNQSMYASYANVKGIPAPEGMTGMSLTGLKVMDTIVSNIRSARNNHEADGDGMDAFRAMVNKFRELQNKNGPYTQQIGKGILFDLTA